MNYNRQLMEAAFHGDIVRVKAAIRNGANVQAVYRGWTALHWAAQEGRLRVVDFLIKNGARVNVRGPEGATPLHQGISHRKVVALLIRNGANVNTYNRETMSTPLHTACAYGYTEIVKLLLSNGAKPSKRDVQIARRYGHKRIVHVLKVPNTKRPKKE